MANIILKQKLILIFLGLIFSAVLLELGLRAGEFVFVSIQKYRNQIAIKQKGTYCIVCLGESTTALGGKNSYPSQLQEILNQQNIGIKFSVINQGIPAITTTAILVNLERILDKYNPDIVITMMGADDNIRILNNKNQTIKRGDILIEKKVLFIQKFKTYRLLKLFWMHIIDKVAGVHVLTSKVQNSAVSNVSLIQSQCVSDMWGIGKDVVELYPQKVLLYLELGRWYQKDKEDEKAEQMFQAAMSLDLESRQQTFLTMGKLYENKREYKKAEQMFKNVLKINPENSWAYLLLGNCYKSQGRYNEADEMYKKGIEINPDNDELYLSLGRWYVNSGEYQKAGQVFKKALELCPGNSYGCLWLDICYRRLQNNKKIEQFYKNGIAVNPENEKLYAGLAVFYEEQGKYKLAERYFKKSTILRLKNYNPVTRYNYQKMKEVLISRGIKWVCMQYPVRKLQSLKKMFKDTNGIIFVDNEMVFRQAIRRKNYDEYFVDKFGGEFGHCTPQGNKLLAENLANVMLKKCFNK